MLDTRPFLFDHLIRPLKHVDWNCQTNLFGCLDVDDEFKLRSLAAPANQPVWRLSRSCVFFSLFALCPMLYA
jgi:hypothetical protein